MEKYRFHIYIRGIILIGFTMLMFKLIITGNIINFIAPKMLPFVYFAVCTFFLLGIIQIFRSSSKNEEDLYCNCGADHEESNSPVQSVLIYLLFIFPIITGFVFPNIVLDSELAAKRGFKTTLQSTNEAGRQTEQENVEEFPSSSPDIPLEHPEGFEIKPPPDGFYERLEKEMLGMNKILFEDDQYIAMTNIIDEYPKKFINKEIELIGFVYREENFNENEFVIARFGLSCCVADASVYGTLAAVHDATQYKNDEWVRVSGKLATTEYEGYTIPYLLIQKIKKIDQPQAPYVYENY
ncbi:TIGR03943 family protein [Metabacillus fastidiosus]|uniref:TIGR03943 family protein n=1 Tax=Metabacillus fastidiosus TaxID=1458 RepID=A0ABU6NVY0_9BACI|nr:TIGR03943 family protein [Metabacillus fastidiosus]MED4401288.1 TIGR03943 family protein [Metabacillus fastidiosus]MED4464215.1 TIGR03943 family protein [Metabacillus fastidiosus]